jgi:hypothetical protein
MLSATVQDYMENLSRGDLMKKMTAFYIFAALFFIVSVAIHILFAEDPNMIIYSDAIAFIVAILPVVTSLYVYSYFKKGNPEKTVWLVLCVGLILWLLGEILWFYYEALRGVDPFPSLADIAWILGYPSLFVALFLLYRNVEVRVKAYEVAFGIVVLIIAAAVFLLFGHMIPAEEEFTFLEKAASLFYPVADLFLLYLALLITGLYWAGKLGYSWLLIAVGIILYVVGDLWFAYLEWMELYEEVAWHPVDFTWIIGDLLVFLGAAKYRISFEEVPKS